MPVGKRLVQKKYAFRSKSNLKRTNNNGRIEDEPKEVEKNYEGDEILAPYNNTSSKAQFLLIKPKETYGLFRTAIDSKPNFGKTYHEHLAGLKPLSKSGWKFSK